MTDKHSHNFSELKKETADKPVITPKQLQKTDERIGIMQLISGTNAKGEDFFAYVNFRPSLYEEFLYKTANGEKVEVEKYGKVLKKGFGKEPPEEMQAFMEETYGFDPDFMPKFLDELKKHLKGKK